MEQVDEMTECSRCGRTLSEWERDLRRSVCSQCRREDLEQAAEQQRAWKAQPQLHPRRPIEPLTGWEFIIVGVIIGIIGVGICGAGVGNRAVVITLVGEILLSIAWLLCVVGAVCWVVSGNFKFQLNRVHRQNLEMLDLLEIVADKGGHSKALDILRDQMEGGQLSHEEYRRRRRELLRGESGGGA